MRIVTACLILSLLANSVPAAENGSSKKASDKKPAFQVSEAAQRANMDWWRDARFGMFIHWGVYSVPAGTYQGKKIPGIGEWIMQHAEIPSRRVQGLRQRFQPREVRSGRLGQNGQRRRHEIHRHHGQAPRRLRLVRLQGDRLGRRRRHPLRQGLAPSARGRLQKERPQARLLLFPSPGLDPSGRRKVELERRRRLGRCP